MVVLFSKGQSYQSTVIKNIKVYIRSLLHRRRHFEISAWAIHAICKSKHKTKLIKLKWLLFMQLCLPLRFELHASSHFTPLQGMWGSATDVWRTLLNINDSTQDSAHETHWKAFTRAVLVSGGLYLAHRCTSQANWSCYITQKARKLW